MNSHTLYWSVYDMECDFKLSITEEKQKGNRGVPSKKWPFRDDTCILFSFSFTIARPKENAEEGITGNIPYGSVYDKRMPVGIC